MFLKNGVLIRGKFLRIYCKDHVKVTFVLNYLLFPLNIRLVELCRQSRNQLQHISLMLFDLQILRYFGHHCMVFVLPFWSDNLLFDIRYVTCYCTVWLLCRDFNPIQDRVWGQKDSPTNFFPVASTSVGISHKTFWLLVLTFLPHYFKAIPSASRKLLNLN